MFVVTFTKFTQVILVHWCVISIACKMTCEQLVNNTKMDKQHASMVHTSVNFELSCTVFMIILSDKCSKANYIYIYIYIYIYRCMYVI